MKKRVLAMLLTLLMVIGMLPMAVFADGDSEFVAQTENGIDEQASNSTVVLHPSVGNTVTGVKINVGDTISGYKVSAISGYEITVDLGTYNVNNGTFTLPYAKDIWEGVDDNKVDYISWAGLGSNRRNEGASALLANGKNTAYYYFKGKPAVKEDITLSYDGNHDGTVENVPSSQTKTVDQGTSATFTIAATSPKCTCGQNHKFLGWSKNPGATAAEYQPGGSITISKSTTLYAVWAEHKHNDGNGDGFCDDDGTCMHPKDSEGYCTIDGCEHPHEGDGACCPKRNDGPGEDDKPDLTNMTVSVVCKTVPDTHFKQYNYSDLDGYFVIGPSEKKEDDKYHCTVTLNRAAVVGKFITEIGKDHDDTEPDATISWNWTWDVTNKVWTMDIAQTDVWATIYVKCEAEPVIPDIPGKDENVIGGSGFNFHCVTEGAKHNESNNTLQVTLRNHPEAYTVGTAVMKKADPNGVERYYFEVTVTDVAAYLPDYNIHYGSHKIRDGQPETLTLTFWLYDSGSWGQWSAQTVDVECVKEPVGEPSLSGLKIKVACVENKSGHKTEGQHYGLDHYKNYTTSNANGIYTITVDKAFYIGRYTNTTKVTHTEAGENSNEIKWQWTGEEWKLLNEKDNKGGVLTINVKCEKEEPKPEYAVTYNYDDSVPDEVKKTLPTDSMKYPVGEEVTVLAPTSTEVIAKGCIWKFKTWKLDEEVEPEAKVPMVEGGLKFHGIWESTPIAPTEKYTLTINYVDQYNRKLHGSYTGQYVENELYSVRSPEIYGYRTYDTVVEGKMPARNVTINVVYYVEQIFPGGMWPTYPPHVKKDEKPQVTEEVSENPLKFDTIHHFAYVNGYPDGLVRPENDITRAEVAAILYRLMEESSVAKFYKASCGFYDVAADAWYSTYVSTLDNAGVITDSASGYFRPDEAITRAELAAMLAPFATVTDAKNTFSDVSDSHWAADAIAVCAKMGWIKGYPDGTFRPDQTITRAEMMAMVNRALDRTPQTVEDLLPDMKTWADNADTDMWYYLDVQEATNSHTYVKSDAHETWEKLIPDMGF